MSMASTHPLLGPKQDENYYEGQVWWRFEPFAEAWAQKRWSVRDVSSSTWCFSGLSTQCKAGEFCPFFQQRRNQPQPGRRRDRWSLMPVHSTTAFLSEASEGVQPPLGWCHTQEEVYAAVVTCVLLKTSFRSRKHSIMNAPLNGMCYVAKVNSCRSKLLERGHMCPDSHHTSWRRLPRVWATDWQIHWNWSCTWESWSLVRHDLVGLEHQWFTAAATLTGLQDPDWTASIPANWDIIPGWPNHEHIPWLGLMAQLYCKELTYWDPSATGSSRQGYNVQKSGSWLWGVAKM